MTVKDNNSEYHNQTQDEILLRKAIARTIMDLRGKMSVDDFGVLIGVSRTNVYKMESGKRSISLKSENSILEVFKLTKETYKEKVKNHLNHLKSNK